MSSPDVAPYSGSCLCRAVRFEVTPPTKWCAICHCSMCRRAHGAASVAWFGVVRAQLRLTAGSGSLARHRSSPEATRSFCRECGSSMFFESTRWAGEVHVALAAMDVAIDREPGAHVFFDDRAPWSPVLDRLPRLGGPSGTQSLDDPAAAAVAAADPRVRIAEAKDAAEVDRLLSALAEVEWEEAPPDMRANLERFLRAHVESRVLLVEVEGRARGLAVVHAFPSPAEGGTQFFLDDIYVEAEARRQGLGAALMRGVVALARASGAALGYLSTRPDNDGARRLFERHGFEVTPDVLYQWAPGP